MSDGADRLSKLEHARLVLSVGHVQVPLTEIPSNPDQTKLTEGLVPPDITAPNLEGAFVMPPLQTVAIKEVLRHTAFARLSVSLPLMPFEKKLGPFRLTLGPGHRALIDLEVKEGFIDRKNTQGRIEPPIDLPLGAKLRGLRLGNDGSIVVDLQNFPDLNLSALSLGNLKVPEAVEDLVALWPDDGESGDDDPDTPAPADEAAGDENPPPPDAPPSTTDDLPLDLAAIEAEASGVRPRPEAFALGDLGTFTLRDPTVFDVSYSEGHLNAGGRVSLEGGDLRGRRFSLAGLSGLGDFRATLDGERLDAGAAFEVNIERGAFDRFAVVLQDGTHLIVGDGSLDGAELSYFKTDDEERLRFAASHFKGRLLQASLRAEIGGRPHAVAIDEMWVEGSVSISPDHVQVDLSIDGAHLSARNLILPLGIAQVWMRTATATASGRLIAGTDYGLSFSGQLSAHGDVQAGEAALLDMHAHLTEGTRAEMHLEELAVSAAGLDVLRAKGELDFRLASGALPLFAGARLSFSRGAEGRLVVDSAELGVGDRFPTVQAHGHIVARSDATSLHRMFELPAGEAHVEAHRIGLNADGVLSLDDLRMWLESEHD